MKRINMNISENDREIYEFLNYVIKIFEIKVEYADSEFKEDWIERLKEANKIRQLFIDTHLMKEDK